MATESSDIIETAVVQDDINGSATLVRSFIVTGISGPASQRLITAIDEPGIFRGDAHPYDPELFVSKRSAKPVNDSSTQFQVDITYTVPQSGSQNEDSGSQVSFGSALSSIQTTKDKSDVEMVVGTIDPNKDGSDAKAIYPTTGSPTVPKQPVLVDKLVPQFVIRASRKETSNPTLTIRDTVGFLNSDVTTIGGVSFAVGTIMCTSITAETQSNGQDYLVSYEFQYRSSWKIDAVAIQPDTGSPWPLIDTVTDGKKEFEIYKSVSMSGLSL